MTLSNKWLLSVLFIRISRSVTSAFSLLSNKWLLIVLFILWAFVIVAIWEGIESLFFSPDIAPLHQPDPRRTGVCAFPEELASSMELPLCERATNPDNVQAIIDLATGDIAWHQSRYSCVHFDDGGKIQYVKNAVCEPATTIMDNH